MTKTELLDDLMQRTMHCPYYGKGPDGCDIGRGYISVSAVHRIASNCSARYAECSTYRARLDRAGVSCSVGDADYNPGNRQRTGGDMSHNGDSRGWIVTFAGTAINLALGILYTWSIFKGAIRDSIVRGGEGAFRWDLCAHSGWQTSLESAQVSERPVVASHTTCAALDARPHARSKPDNVIRAIASTGGYVGICCIPRFLRGNGDISMLLNHIDYVVKKFGVDHVAIGTDVAYSSQNSAAENKKVPRLTRGRTEFRTLWPEDDFQATPQMDDSLAWTNWPLYTVGLVQRGHADDDIRKIIGGNVLRVARESMNRSR